MTFESSSDNHCNFRLKCRGSSSFLSIKAKKFCLVNMGKRRRRFLAGASAHHHYNYCIAPIWRFRGQCQLTHQTPKNLVLDWRQRRWRPRLMNTFYYFSTAAELYTQMVFLAHSKKSHMHSVLKSKKQSHSTLRAKRATFTFWVDKRSLKRQKMVNFGGVLKIWSLRSNSVTRQVNFNWTTLVENAKIEKLQFDIFHF